MTSGFPTGRSAWFALSVRPRHEQTIAEHLRLKGLEPFAPSYREPRRWSDRVRQVEVNLFPGYVFCKLAYENRLEVLNIPSVTSIVGFGRQAAPVPEEEIDTIRTALGSGMPVRPWPYLKAGQKVRIEEGALAGVEGTLAREKDACRVIINIELLQRSIAVEIDRELLRAVRQ